jgi:hypothetical protein
MPPSLAMTISAAEPVQAANDVVMAPVRKAKRKVSSYNRKYKAAFKKVSSRYKLKNGKWKAGGFKRAVKEAHKLAGGKK